jgi:transposase
LARRGGRYPHKALHLLAQFPDLPRKRIQLCAVQAAWVVLIKPKSWERYGLKPWIEAAKKRLHHNVLAIALANKLARIAWAVLNKEHAFECVTRNAMAPRPA